MDLNYESQSTKSRALHLSLRAYSRGNRMSHVECQESEQDGGKFVEYLFDVDY
jgi:hypothetical protein